MMEEDNPLVEKGWVRRITSKRYLKLCIGSSVLLFLILVVYLVGKGETPLFTYIEYEDDYKSLDTEEVQDFEPNAKIKPGHAIAEKSTFFGRAPSSFKT